MVRCGFCFLLWLFLFVSPAADATARTWYIKANGTGDAPTIQAGCDSAQHGDTVLVAAGTYNYSSQGGNQYGMISILRGSADMTIVGEGGASSTILDAQWQNRVVFFQGETELTMDGFTFKRGDAPVVGDFWGGGFAAHFSSPVIKNCKFVDNIGANGGAYWYGGFGTPQILNCDFSNNTATNGAAMYLINSPGSSIISGCTFEDNSATSRGGAIATYNFRVSIEQCFFEGNSGAVEGGAISINNSYPTPITNSTFVANSSAAGGAVSSVGASTVTIDQTIIASGLGGGAVTVDMTSTIQCGCTDIFGNAGGDWTGGIAGQEGSNGNFSADPLFCSSGSGNYYLQDGSPCATGNHPDGDTCGTIGLFGVACATVSIEQRTWGAIKSLYSQ